MSFVRALTALLRPLAMPLAWFVPAAVQAGIPAGVRETAQANFDTALRQTYVSGRIAPNLCLSLTLPQEWRLREDREKIRLKATSPVAEIELGLRSARDLQDLPQPDLAGRDAAFLQRDWEGVLGRPAQSVAVESLALGALRWTATWFDARLPAASQAMTLETFIVPLSREWVLELSPVNVASREAYDDLVRQMLLSLGMVNLTRCEK